PALAGCNAPVDPLGCGLRPPRSTEVQLALDRQSIEKRDFPIGRRGYEPASVDAHLAKVAREVEALQRSSRSAPASASAAAAAPAPGASLASIASSQV